MFEPADEITEKIIGAAVTVSNTLGAGFLKVYELRHGLILNFGAPKVQVKRVVHGF